ncbi:MAG: hypothetical protein U5K70_06435 [Halodesulfurarchaeum sp.]|nr:hypothetical protein [Halodesulfurarchaeum sp.]
MDLSELRRVQRKERSTDSLQELRESFYADVAEYVQSLREERSAAAAEAEDPFRSTKVTDLSKEIETAEHIAEAVYQRRIGKLVDEASLSATGSGGVKSGLTAEEQDLYDDLVARIEENMADVLDQFAGGRPSGDGSEDDPTGSRSMAQSFGSGSTETADDTATETESDSNGGSNPADVMGPDIENDEGPDESGQTADTGDDVDRTTVRMTTDVGEIFGVDAESYDLQRDDIVDLPTENADPLLDRDAAERID